MMRTNSYQNIYSKIIENRIHQLDLSGNNIGDYGIEIICNALAANSFVKSLNLTK